MLLDVEKSKNDRIRAKLEGYDSAALQKIYSVADRTKYESIVFETIKVILSERGLDIYGGARGSSGQKLSKGQVAALYWVFTIVNTVGAAALIYYGLMLGKQMYVMTVFGGIFLILGNYILRQLADIRTELIDLRK